MSDMLGAALEYASRGWPIFPCRTDKSPYTAHGVLESSTDTQKVRDWWTRWPGANIGLDCAGAGFAVVDLDPGSNPADIFNNVPDLTQSGLIQSSPRGGEHWFYRLRDGDVCSPSTSRLADHVDIRSFHSYVLLAPSATSDGAYEWKKEGTIPHVTDEFLRQCNSYREKHEDRDTWHIDADLPENVDQAVAWLRQDAQIAIEGRGGNNMAYATAAYMKSCGISTATAIELMWDHWNPRCEPPWGGDEYEEFERIVHNGYRYNTSPPGNVTAAYKTWERSKLFAPVRKETPSGQQISSGRFTFYSRQALNHIPAPRWLIPGLLQEDTYALLFGASQAFKTFLALDIALGIATSTAPSWLGLENRKIPRAPVLFAVGEGQRSLKQRVRAWEKEHYEGWEVPDSSFVLSGPVPSIGEELEPFVEGALSLNPSYGLVVIDTVGRAMQGFNVNSQEHASSFTAMVEAIKSSLGCTVLAIHHTSHASPDREIGSVVFATDTDTRIKAERFPDIHRTMLQVVKQKDGESWDRPATIDLKTIDLGEDQSSLVAIASSTRQDEAKAAFAASPAKGKKSNQAANADRAAYAEQNKDIAIRHAIAALEAEPHMRFSQRQLADKVSLIAGEELPVNAEAVRKYLRDECSGKKYGLWRYYDLEKGQFTVLVKGHNEAEYGDK